MLRLFVSALLYPGLLTALALGVVYRLLVSGNGRLAPGSIRAAVRSREGLVALASVLATVAGLAALPWPLHPAGAGRAWLWAWVGLELAALLPLLPAISTGRPTIVRAAIRGAQVGVLARALLWAALAVALAIHTDWRVLSLPAHLLALLTALLAFPAAVGWGPFDDELTITLEGTDTGLLPAVRAIDGLARDLRAGALLAALLVATLPVAVGLPWLGILMLGAGFLAVCALLRQLRGSLPRRSLSALLRLCLAWVAPLAAAATIALVVAGGF